MAAVVDIDFCLMGLHVIGLISTEGQRSCLRHISMYVCHDGAGGCGARRVSHTKRLPEMPHRGLLPRISPVPQR
eukprot:scaffold93900_cov17-Prasinocladus_malaysianus.AAC.1